MSDSLINFSPISTPGSSPYYISPPASLPTVSPGSLPRSVARSASRSANRSTHRSPNYSASRSANRSASRLPNSSSRNRSTVKNRNSKPAAAGGAGAAAADAAAIGSGGFGSVFSPAFVNTNFTNTTHNRRNWVTKVFFDKDNYLKAVKNIPTLRNLGFNYNAHPYKRELRISKNVPFAKREELIGQIGSDEIFGLRMPHRGLSVKHLIERKTLGSLRAVPVQIILGQVCKLIHQIKHMGASGYIHGDIRDTNILVDPVTGLLTIIDFDWFDPKATFFSEYFGNFGFYSNPPETLLAPHGVIMKGTYIKQFTTFFVDHPMIRDIERHNHDNGAYLRSVSGSSVMGKNVEIWKKTLDTFDSFGLAWTLLTLFRHLYPRSLDDDIAALKANLATTITKHSIPYTDVELDVCAFTIHAMVQTVLLPMGNFNLTDRQKAADVLERALKLNNRV
jgi:serine/threonine protein kinase